jgi:multidrug efflux pump subunit AcrA (membrane-fusion protein)
MSKTRKTILWVVVAVVALFIVFALFRARPTQAVAEPPELGDVPTRVYGRIEPAGGEVFVAPPVTRSVVELPAAEGDTVDRGRVLCVLESSVEQAALRAAEARVEVARRAWELSRDTRERNAPLSADKRISEYEYNQVRLKAEFDSVNLVAARREVELAAAQLEQLTLRAPTDGIVYKLDVRLGQTLVAGDNKSIILGASGLWARLYVEAFWTDRVQVGTHLRLYDAETHEDFASGTVIRKAPYLGTREIRTEDTRARLDAEFQEVIVEIDELKRQVPVGLYVLAELEE